MAPVMSDYGALAPAIASAIRRWRFFAEDITAIFAPA
jgi:hypothetical protein